MIVVLEENEFHLIYVEISGVLTPEYSMFLSNESLEQGYSMVQCHEILGSLLCLTCVSFVLGFN
jgi:hypothetical protein